MDFEQKVENEYLTRAARFVERLSKKITEQQVILDAEVHHSKTPIPLKETFLLKRVPIKEGEVWGNTWESGYFKLTGKVPLDWKGASVAALLDFNGEALVYSNKGVPLYGLTQGSVFDLNYSKDCYLLLDSCRGGEAVELFVESAANGLFGLTRKRNSDRNAPDRHGKHEGKIIRLRLTTFSQELWHFWFDMRILLDLAKRLPKESVRRSRLVRGLNQAVNAFADDAKNTATAASLLIPLLKNKNSGSVLTSVAVGHAHIDTAWLWPLQETIRKTARTFASQLSLLKQYPDYVFGASQAQLYQFMKEHHPELYEQIKVAVKGGRWEVQGGMWVEADCNLISGESMVRQFVHGKNFFKKEFGLEIKNLWLPDVFGYSANLPQILKRSGIDYFLTQKLSWSQFNVFPHHTFNWQGIDGSTVITHFPPEDTYNSTLFPSGQMKAQDNFKEKAFLDEFLCLYGIGNGGGGPKEEHVENGIRQRDLEGCPKVVFGRADKFFERLGERQKELAVYVGELYLELHRGTLTTQARTKKYNRLLENRLRQVEALCSLLPLNAYPREQLDKIWKKLLTRQFHDIIPGSSIHLVYEEAEATYAACLKECDEIIHSTVKGALPRAEETVTLFNVTAYPVKKAVQLPEAWTGACDAKGNNLPAQRENGSVWACVEIAPYSLKSIKPGSRAEAASETEGAVLENELVRYRFSKQGLLLEVYDKEAGRAVVAPEAPGNCFSLYEDNPNQYDAWDIDFFYKEACLETAACVSISPVLSGPVRSSLNLEFSIGHSRIKQKLILERGSKRLEFKTTVDWNETYRMLRVAFPVLVAAPEASFDIQYGFIKRPTHANTSWDFARFETVGHRYADLSDSTYGVALLNDCKYGYAVRGNTLDLNLLRAPREPDPDADQGQHEFTYAFLPHTDDLIHSPVMAEAESLNLPLVPLTQCALERSLPVFLTGEGVSMTVLKKAETEECWIARCVETRGIPAKAALHCSGRLVETDLMEWKELPSVTVSEKLEIGFTPFEIKTFKIFLTNTDCR